MRWFRTSPPTWLLGRIPSPPSLQIQPEGLCLKCLTASPHLSWRGGEGGGCTTPPSPSHRKTVTPQTPRSWSSGCDLAIPVPQVQWTRSSRGPDQRGLGGSQGRAHTGGRWAFGRLGSPGGCSFGNDHGRGG